MPDSAPPASHRPPRKGPDEETLTSLGRVTGELLHDIVGLVGILSSRAALVREDARVGRPVTEEINRISRDCDYLKVMVSDIVQELRGRQRSPEIAFNVAASLQDVVDRWLSAAPSVTTRMSSSARATLQVAGPRSFFSRALTNLLQNAARHARSEIRLSIDEEHRGGNAGVLVAVEDDGEGILPELRGRVFEPLARGNFGGTGLGLSFAQWAVGQLEGEIAHRDGAELGGARFEVWLPVLADRSVKGVEETAERTDGALTGIRVTVVDDEPMIRRMYRRLLEKSGAEVEEVVPRAGIRCGDIAGGIAAQNPDVILLDLNLSGWSGVEVWEALAEKHPRLSGRVLFLSGDVWSGKELEAGLPPRVSKLIAWEELVGRITKLAHAGSEAGRRT